MPANEPPQTPDSAFNQGRGSMHEYQRQRAGYDGYAPSASGMNGPAASQQASRMSGGYNRQAPAAYQPGQFGFKNNPDMSQMVTMMAGPLLAQAVGPENFLPQLQPAQNMADQFSMRSHQNNAYSSTYATNTQGDANVANRLTGMRKAITSEPATELNKKQAASLASLANNPLTKMIAGETIGPENLEAAMHGRKGDIASLNKATSAIGYTRPGAQGGSRATAENMSDFTTGVHDTVYAPENDTAQLAKDTRSGKKDSAAQLKRAARLEHKEIVDDADITERMATGENAKENVSRLYDKYVEGGKATDTKEQAQELTKFHRAVADSGVLKQNETSVSQLKKAADEQNINKTHGFMASDVGTLMQSMHQKGELPKAMGNMTADERVKLIQQTGPRDDATMTKMAREYGHRELLKTKDYAAMDSDGQKSQLDAEEGKYKKTLNSAFSDLDKSASGGKGAKSAMELEKTEGVDFISSKIDAGRVGEAAKSKLGALAAVKEIFGDNGNPNAPMSMLIAALDGLSAGTTSQVDSKKIEGTIRAMQVQAKDVGMGMEDLQNLSAEMGARGDINGTAKSVSMESTGNVLSNIKTMDDRGAFANPQHGALNRAEAAELIKQREARGNASPVAVAMGALVTKYKANPEKFKGKNGEVSKMQAIVEAYQKGEKTYTYDDPTTGKKVTNDLTKELGEKGVKHVEEVFKEAGGKSQDLNAARRDERSKVNIKSGYAAMAQTHELAARLDKPTSGTVNREVNQRIKEGTAGSHFQDMDKATLKQTKAATSKVITAAILESADMAPDKQLDYLQKTVEPGLEQMFRQQGHPDPKGAAKQMADNVLGVDPAEQRNVLDRMVTDVSNTNQAHTGVALVANHQTMGEDQAQKSFDTAQQQRKQAETKKDAGLAYNSNPLARGSDYFDEIATSGEKFTSAGLIEAIAQPISDRDMRDRVGGKLAAGFNRLQSVHSDNVVTDSHVAKLAKDNNQTELRKLAKLDKNVTILSDTERNTKRAEMVAGLSQEDVDKKYEQFVPNADKATSTPEERRKQVATNSKVQQELDSSIFNKDTMSLDQVAAAAKQVSGGEARTPESKQRLADVKRVSHGFLNATDQDAVLSGMDAAVSLTKSIAGGDGLKDVNTEKLRDLAMAQGPDAQANINKEIAAMDKAGKFKTTEQKDFFTDILHSQQGGTETGFALSQLLGETETFSAENKNKPIVSAEQQKQAQVVADQLLAAPSVATQNETALLKAAGLEGEVPATKSIATASPEAVAAAAPAVTAQNETALLKTAGLEGEAPATKVSSATTMSVGSAALTAAQFIPAVGSAAGLAADAIAAGPTAIPVIDAIPSLVEAGSAAAKSDQPTPAADVLLKAGQQTMGEAQAQKLFDATKQQSKQAEAKKEIGPAVTAQNETALLKAAGLTSEAPATKSTDAASPEAVAGEVQTAPAVTAQNETALLKAAGLEAPPELALAAEPQSKKTTPAQDKLLAELDKNPNAIQGMVTDSSKRSDLLSLPDATVREMFNKLSPEKKKSAASDLKALGDGDWRSKMLGLTPKEKEQFTRIHAVATTPEPDVSAAEPAPPPAKPAVTAQNETALLKAAGLEGEAPATKSADTASLDAVAAEAQTAPAVTAQNETALLKAAGLEGEAPVTRATGVASHEAVASASQAEPAVTAQNKTALLKAAGLADEAPATEDYNPAGTKLLTGPAKAARDILKLKPADLKTATRDYNPAGTGMGFRRRADKEPAAPAATVQNEIALLKAAGLEGEVPAITEYNSAGTRAGFPRPVVKETSDEQLLAGVIARNDNGLMSPAGLKPAATGHSLAEAGVASLGPTERMSGAANKTTGSLQQSVAGIREMQLESQTIDTVHGRNAAQQLSGPGGSRNTESGGGNNGGTQKLTINGTLSLQGLTEAILNASGEQPVQTDGGGAPVVPGPQRFPSISAAR